MTDEQPRIDRSLDPFKLVVLLVLIATSGLVVWSYYQSLWPEFLVYLIVAFLVGSMAGTLVRVPLISTWAVMGTTSGLFGGISKGWQRVGWIGILPGGLIGTFCGLVVAMLLSLCLSFVLVMCGIDPFVNAEAE